PEVETIVRDLRPRLEGRDVRAAGLSQPGVLRYPVPSEFKRRIVGRRLQRVGRHGKFMLVELAGAELEFLVIHLGMTGRLGMHPPEAAVAPHTHLRLLMSSGEELRLQDYRRFGRVLLGSPLELAAAGMLPALGPEPPTDAIANPGAWGQFSRALTPQLFEATLRRSRRAVKALLLDQAAVAGLGNIYADEACFRAGVRPTAVAARLGPARRERLYTAIGEALRSAVDLRGTTFDDYRDANGEQGLNQHRLLVYGRAGQPCVRCGAALRRIVVAGRTTVFCPRCQR
ncbi:MAG TPA: bifunctional DNA-formamidopyrimidine glycosylase/DNA-(apurinic or apyrimidinic site) lyase, partial [Candidatus Dormibacteraeota bacterium]|nr:bifunctional DNA-formamidopyrimidine glycosylase/DNA-(apurinic or apyrimidinic site) lyase [Candidatus Dormibacteraeota bacterium]